MLQEAYMSVYEDFESEAYVPLHRGEDEAGPIPTMSWSKKMSRALVNVGKEKFKGRMGGETNIARGVAATRKLNAMKAVDSEPEDVRRKRSEGKSAANRALGQSRRSLQTQMDRQHLERSFNREDVNVFDILISHLLDEGYAEDVKNAYCILENMSEDWALEILDEASLRSLALNGAKSAVKAVRDYGADYPMGSKRRAVSDTIDKLHWASLSDAEKKKRTNAKHRARNTKKGHEEIMARNRRAQEIIDRRNRQR